MLLEAEVDGRKLNDMEYTLFFMFLIVAGNETTRTATSHGLLSLLEHRDSLDRLVADPDLIPLAVEEILRWQPPIHHFRRTATADVEVGGQKIAKGDKVLMWYAGANRDPSVFEHPHTFDIDRSPNPQLSFGIGEHFVWERTWPGSHCVCRSPNCWRRSRTSSWRRLRGGCIRT
ncbi:MAG: cytochrome P450 [Microthrixaceae bacterium]